jgi:hypothetical protein
LKIPAIERGNFIFVGRRVLRKQKAAAGIYRIENIVAPRSRNTSHSWLFYSSNIFAILFSPPINRIINRLVRSSWRTA